MQKLYSTIAAFLTLGALVASAWIVQAQPPQGRGGPPPKGGFKGGKGKGGGGGGKNLQVLTPGTDIPATMQGFVQALGLLDDGACAFCHADDKSSDEKTPKVVARRMITMVRAINGTFPDGEQHVSCYTCHRGEKEPPLRAP